MGVKSKVSEHDKDTAVKRYAANEASVIALAKQYKVSVPAVYQWIRVAKERQAEALKAARMSPETARIDKKVNLELLVKEQEQQIAALKSRLLDLMTKYNEW